MSENMDSEAGNGSGQKKKGSALKLGCAIGCGVILLLIIAGFGVGYYFLKDTISAFRATDKSAEELKKKFGDIRSYCPEQPLTIAPERMEQFLKLRESLQKSTLDAQKALHEISQALREAEAREKAGDKSFSNGLKAIDRLKDILPLLANYMTVRNRLFITYDMNPAEYNYIYVLAYYSLLGKPATEGMVFGRKITLNQQKGPKKFFINLFGTSPKEETEGEINRESSETGDTEPGGIKPGDPRHIRDMMLPMLKCQRQKLPAADMEQDSARMRDLLEKEIEKLEQDESRIPWNDGLPDSLKNALEPFRNRLEKSWTPELNAFEMSLTRRGAH